VGIEVFAEARIESSCPLLLQIRPWMEVLKNLAVVLAAGDNCAEHRGEGVARHFQPVSPCSVLAGLVDKYFPDVGPDGADRHRTSSSSVRDHGELLVEHGHGRCCAPARHCCPELDGAMFAVGALRRQLRAAQGSNRI
jgi:hypothetical protein